MTTPALLAELGTLVRERRTIQDYRDDTPPRETVLEALDEACWAPNHRRTEPWRFTLLGRACALQVSALNAELVAAKQGAEAAEAKLRRWSAMPGWLVVTCIKTPDQMREQEDYAACCCVVQNLALTLWARGIGMKWGTGKVTRDLRFFQLIQADPATEFAVGLFWYGYPAEVPKQTRRPLNEFLKIIE